MKNIPVYMSQGGTATLILTEIPHRSIAYIILRTIIPGKMEELLQECAAFCKNCGATLCLVSSEHADLSSYLPHAYDIYQLRAQKIALPTSFEPVPLAPICQENDAIYQRIYNQCFCQVSHAMTYERKQILRIYQMGYQAFLAFTKTGQPCGIGELHENELAAVGLLPEYRGSGKDLTLTLLSHCPGPEITLTVVSNNSPALSMYDKLGFSVYGVESKWYQL